MKFDSNSIKCETAWVDLRENRESNVRMNTVPINHLSQNATNHRTRWFKVVRSTQLVYPTSTVHTHTQKRLLMSEFNTTTQPHTRCLMNHDQNNHKYVNQAQGMLETQPHTHTMEWKLWNGEELGIREQIRLEFFSWIVQTLFKLRLDVDCSM